MFVAWSPILSIYLAIIRISSRKAPSLSPSAIIPISASLTFSKYPSTTSSSRITFLARSRSCLTNELMLAVTMPAAKSDISRRCLRFGTSSSLRYFTISAISAAWSPILSISPIILRADDITLRSLATGCCCKRSLMQMDSISLSIWSICFSASSALSAISLSLSNRALMAYVRASSHRAPMVTSSTLSFSSC